MIGLDYLPWPWGEDILAGLFTAAALVQGSRRRRAIAWASQHSNRRAWRLVLAACAFRGRWVARSALVGVRRPDDLRRRIVLRGEEHLTPTSTGTILLGFHLGPPGVDVALRIMGHRLAWLGGGRTSRAWWREAWRPLLDPKDNLTPRGSTRFWPGYLYRARRILLEGGTVFTMADDWSWRGHEVLPVPVAGGALFIMPGWLALWRQTDARVLPVLTHLAGRAQVITIHPPLAGDGAEGKAWPDALSVILKAHVARFPEQGPNLLFPVTADSE
jgi:lauroyl/myristoyl acyltransferase